MDPGDPRPMLTARPIGGSGVSVFPVAVDGSVFGWAAGSAETIEVLDSFAAGGGQLISTADHYAGGRSEVMIGAWLRRRTDRERFVVATKVGRHPDHPGLSAASVTAAVNASLERLATDYIDLLSFDGDHPETPVDETLEAAQALIESGKVRMLGESGYPTARLEEVQGIAVANGRPRFTAALAEYSLMERPFVEQELGPVARRLGISVLARLPLASGYLTGAYRSRDTLPESVMFANAFQYIGRRGTRVLAALETVAEEHAASLAEVALAWVLARPEITAAVARARDGAQLLQVMGAAQLQLTRSQVAALDAASS